MKVFIHQLHDKYIHKRIRQTKIKNNIRSQIIKDYPLPESDIVPTSARWIQDGMTLSFIVASQYTCRYQLKVLVKYSRQNQAINIEIVNDRNLVS